MTLDEFKKRFAPHLVLLGLHGLKMGQETPGPFNVGRLAMEMPDTVNALLAEMYNALAQPEVVPPSPRPIAHNARRT